MKLSQSCIYKLPILILSFLLVFQTTVNAQTTYYVDANSVISNGTLANPFASIGEAIAVATSGTDTVLITADVYFITATLNVNNDMVIKGGYDSSFSTQINYSRIDGGHTFGTTDGVRVFATNGLSSAAIFDHLQIEFGYHDSIGGGMFNYNSSPTILNVDFNDNACYYYGGGMHNYYSSPILSNVNFNRNFTRLFGAGMYNAGSSPILNEVNFNENISWDYGGGMHNNYSFPTLTNVIFYRNTAGDSGGGICNENYSSPTLTNISFIQNETTNTGGGMGNFASSPTLTNVTFIENKTRQNGGAIYNVGSSPILINVSFCKNESLFCAGGIFSEYNSFPLLYNTVFYGNIADSIISDIVIGTNTGNIDSLSSNNASDGNGGGISTTNASTFVDLSAYNFTDIFTDTNYSGSDNIFGTSDDGLIPILNSPLINAGSNSYNLFLLDLAGFTRIFNSTIDIGAYEYQYLNPGIQEKELSSISIYPNPTTDKVYINAKEASDIIIYNISGSIIQTLKVTSEEQVIDFSTYPIGIYIVRVISGNTVLGTQKIIKD